MFQYILSEMIHMGNGPTLNMITGGRTKKTNA